jgi:hypothetical protein
MVLFLFGNRELHQRFFLGNFTTCLPGRTSHVNATKGVSSVCEPLPPDRPLWFPGSSPPEWLDGRYQIFHYLYNKYISTTILFLTNLL